MDGGIKIKTIYVCTKDAVWKLNFSQKINYTKLRVEKKSGEKITKTKKKKQVTKKTVDGILLVFVCV